MKNLLKNYDSETVNKLPLVIYTAIHHGYKSRFIPELLPTMRFSSLTSEEEDILIKEGAEAGKFLSSKNLKAWLHQ